MVTHVTEIKYLMQMNTSTLKFCYEDLLISRPVHY